MGTKDTIRAKRDELRKKRTEIRDKVRGVKSAVKASAIATILVLCVGIWPGCNTAQPSSKGQTSRACDNNVIFNITLAANPTNAPASGPVSFSFTLSDLIGTQTQSADAGTSDTTSQSATPTMSSGLTGDKPIDAAAGVAKSAITAGVSDAAAAAGTAAAALTSTTNSVAAQTSTMNSVAQ